MKLLYDFDKHDYNELSKISHREAVRAIIIKNGKIAMVRSNKEGFYKFPGGGIKQDESHQEALIREAREETGLCIIPDSIREFGYIRERRKSTMFENEIFEHHSYYYFAEADDEISQQELDGYEEELEFVLEFTDIENAKNVNAELGEKYYSDFLLREVKALELLQEYLKNTVAKS